MIVFLWFTMVGFVILVGFTYLGVISYQSYKQRRMKAHVSKGITPKAT